MLRTLASTPTPIKAQVQYHATVFVLTSNRLPSLIPVEARLAQVQTGSHHHKYLMPRADAEGMAGGRAVAAGDHAV
ncbi:hypothetical protein Taro_040407 [Colocasia esculenta]|uniref:Uncharacterized protein n=1 Tax=Colocasia esculenta TaxID=4460 RepID=A0A843WJ02_COLES|nr:hypothetical protein [Colocasia esculenta]